jgi:hypothetical protein
MPNLRMGLRKYSLDISKKTVEWVPLVPLDRIWTDLLVDEWCDGKKN